MSRIFRRGELKEAIVLVLASLGEAHGYSIMAKLKDQIGGGWKPSPGAIYPALLALVETRHVEAIDRDGTRMYSLTKLGRRVAKTELSSSRWASLAERAERGDERVAVGPLLDRFAEGSNVRRRLAKSEQRQRIEAILARAGDEIERTLEEGVSDG